MDPRVMPRLFKPFLNLLLVVAIGIGLSGCVTTSLPMAASSPWEAQDLNTKANPLDVSFSDNNHGFLVGTNRMILETNDGGASWQERDLDLPEEENFRLISIDFSGDEGWLAGQPSLIMHSQDAGQTWTRLFLDAKLPGEPYLITSLGSNKAELATNVGAVYQTNNGGKSWEAEVNEAAGAIRDLRRSKEGGYVSASSLGNFYASLNAGEDIWKIHQRPSSQRVQTIGYQPNGELWMVSRGAQIRLNNEKGDPESWSKPIIPITNGYGYLDMAWDPSGKIWAGGGNGTLLVSEDQGSSWQLDPIGQETPTNLNRIIFSEIDGDTQKGFILGERGRILQWVG